MIARVKEAVLGLSQRSGMMARVRTSSWRQQRLLILCYHGVSIDDEHLWNPRLYVPADFLRRRLELLRRGGYEIVPLDEGVRRLHEGSLPAGAVALTFDDGAHDFYARAFPVLQEFGVPATVYQTTYYSDFNRPVYDTMVSYLLWKGRRDAVSLEGLVPGTGVRDLREAAVRAAVHRQFLRHAVDAAMTGAEKNDLAVRLAEHLGVDMASLLHRRLLHMMNPEEIRDLAARGIDFQLHTHRHRTPNDRGAFLAEIAENREWLARVTGRESRHFCYPSGVYRRDMLDWLEASNVLSATTCDPGIATASAPPLLLPRFVDNMAVSDRVFTAWASGVAEFLPRRTRYAHPEQRDL